MGSSQSIPTTSEITDAPRFSAVASNKQDEEHFASSKNGPKTQPIETNLISHTENTVKDAEGTLSVASTTTTESDDDYDYDSSDEEDDDELDEFIAERKRILADANDLKQLAIDFLHPEKSVVVPEPTVFARNYFGRASAPTKYDDDANFLTTMSRVRDGCVDRDMEEERKRIIEEAAELKKIAEWYHLPNKPVVTTDASACASNYYSRTAPTKHCDDDNFLTTMSRVRDGFVDSDMEEERERILEEAAELKKIAGWCYLPNKPVITTDALACASNYYSRVSVPECDEEDERERVLEEAAELKKVADWHLHPEKPIVSDASIILCGRNYYSRPSAPEYDDDNDERERVLDEAAELKKVADWHLHSDKKIEVDPAVFGRNFFSSALAEDDEDERDRILEEAAELKKVADWHLHPEKKIEVDPAVFGRNFYSSAPEDDEDERERILEEAAELEKVADWYLHPEKKIEVDPAVFGRKYFSSTPQEDDDERERVLEEASELKMVAAWYLHPEQKIEVDPTVFGCNYFSSTPEDDDLCDERERVLEEAVELKKVAAWYLHPEQKIEVDPVVFGRNYFSLTPEEDNLDEERERVLEEASELKKVAGWHLHPEQKIEVDSTVFARNYFGPSEQDNDDALDEERERVLEEAAELKKVAGWHLHPEQKIGVDPTAFARNYFGPSEQDDDHALDEERERVLEEAAQLKKVAGWHLHPEQKIEVDPTASARNYYSSSAPDDLHEERERILAEAVELKQVAGWHLHPEKLVAPSSVNCASNYFQRASINKKNGDDLEERERVLEEMAELKKHAIDYFHPEKPVAPSSVNCSRNYFNRASAKGDHAEYIHTQGYANHPEQHMEEHYVMHDDDYHHYDCHYDDVSHSSFNSHGDHFDMDEDVFHGFRESINAFRDSVTAIHDQQIPIIKEEGDGKEGNLSRSPSSIMLFEEPAM